MSQETQPLARMFASFEDCRFEHDGADAWRARSLMPLLGYVKWQRFRDALQRAWESCAASGIDPSANFLVGDGSKPWRPEEVFTGSGKNLPEGGVGEVFTDSSKNSGGATQGVFPGAGKNSKRRGADEVFRGATKNPKGGRPSEDVILTRRAAYLVAMNGDPSKPEIGFAQNYFAASTRTLEVLQKRLTERTRLQAHDELAETESRFQAVLYERDVDGPGFDRIRAKGDKKLLGGKSMIDMRGRWDVPAGRALADFAPEVVVVAKRLGAAMTAHNVQTDDLRGEPAIAAEHVANSDILRESLVLRGIQPEELPGAEDIRKVERRHKSVARRLVKAEGRRRRGA